MANYAIVEYMAYKLKSLSRYSWWKFFLRSFSPQSRYSVLSRTSLRCFSVCIIFTYIMERELITKFI